MRVPTKVNHGFTIFDQFREILENHCVNSEKNKIHE